MTFGNRLYNLRTSNGLSQEELGNKINVSGRTVSDYESGEVTPDMEKLVMLAACLSVSLDELVLGAKSAETSAPVAQSSFWAKFDTVANGENNSPANKRIRAVVLFILGFFTVVLLLALIFIISGRFHNS